MAGAARSFTFNAGKRYHERRTNSAAVAALRCSIEVPVRVMKWLMTEYRHKSTAQRNAAV